MMASFEEFSLLQHLMIPSHYILGLGYVNRRAGVLLKIEADYLQITCADVSTEAVSRPSVLLF